MRGAGSAFEQELRAALWGGLIDAEEAPKLAGEARLCGRSPLELLFEKGLITAATLASLRLATAEAGGADGPSLETTSVAATAAGALDATGAAFPLPGWDRYQPVRLLGQGGMGRVFLARDLRLHREVALKFMLGDDPRLARRFVAEARAQARVSHERVCEVYEVGEVDGKVYIAMQYIDGCPLGELCGQLTVEQKAMLVRGAALGAHEAHRAGIIHRDIKPGNIMVARADDGELLPYVMDFGLARDWKEGTTITGTVLGTPHYMAPEQARGEVALLDRRADVYSLGATLYAALVGRAPVSGDNPLEVLANIAAVEPPPLRAIERDLPADLEAVVMKCLEKDRSARYDSARALADDLGSFLAGEPVRARAGLGYRLRKRLRKHTRLVAGAAVVLALLAAVLGYALRERRQTARREELARRFTERVAHIESLARYSALARLHDARADRARIRAEMSALAGEIRAAGAIADGPGHYALGCGYLALGEDDRAAEELEAAWRGGFRAPRAAYALALATGHLYQRALHAVERLRSDQLREQRRVEIERRYRAPALLYLRESRGADVPSLDYVAALIAFYEGRYDDALRSLAAIDRRDGSLGLAWFYEAPLLRGEILRVRGRAHRLKGESEEAAADFEASRRAFATAAAVAESDPAVHEALGELEYSALVAELYGHGEVGPPFERGIAAAERALAILPERAEALSLRARFERSMAEHRGNRGEDVTALLTRATADAQRAVALAPQQRESEARLELARTWRQWGEYRQIRSEDPAEQLGKATAIASAIPPAERDYDFHVHLGLCFATWASYQEQLGLDSQENRSRAIDAYTKAIKLNDRLNDVWMNLGISYYNRAEQPRNRDADGDIVRAIDAFERGHALMPKHIAASFYLGRLHLLRARRRMAAAGDAGPELTLALAAYREGVGINPRMPQLHSGIGSVLVEQARIAWDRGMDPFPLLMQAKASYERAAAVAPSFATAHNNIGKALIARARYLRARGEEPEAALRDAVSAFRRTLALTPDDAEVWAMLGTVEALSAEASLDAGRSPVAHLLQARTAADRAVAKAPKLKEALLADAEAKAAQARWRTRTGQGRDDDFNSAAQSFARVIELAPDDIAASLEYAAFCLTWASWLDKVRQDPEPPLERGLEITEQVLKKRPTWPDALVLHGGLLLARARHASRGEQQRALASGAAGDFQRALAANPNLQARWRVPAHDAARLAGAAR